MRKWIVGTAAIALLSGAVAGFLGGIYIGFRNAQSLHAPRLFQERVHYLGIHASYYRLATEGAWDQLRANARMWMLLEALPVAWIFEDLDDASRRAASRNFRRILNLVEHDESVPNEQERQLTLLREYAAPKEPGD